MSITRNKQDKIQNPIIVAKNKYGELITFDGNSLNGRIPIICISGNPMSNFSFMPFNPLETKMYHYLFEGNLHDGLDEIAGALIKFVVYAPELHKRSDIRIITHGLGGIIARIALQSTSSFGWRIRKIYTLGCPHCGTPIVEPCFIREAMEGMVFRKLLWDAYLSDFAGAKWQYELATREYPLTYSINQWNETKNELKKEKNIKYFSCTEPLIKGERLCQLNMYDKQKGKVFAVAGTTNESRIAFIIALNADESVYRLLARIMRKIPGVGESDGIVPLSSAMAEGLGIEAVKYPKDITHAGYLTDRAFWRWFMENIFE